LHPGCTSYISDVWRISRVYPSYILFHKLLSARLPMNIRLTSPLHTTNVHFFPLLFWQSFTIFSRAVPLHLRMQNGCKTFKKSFHPYEYAMHPLCTLCIRVSNALSIEHPPTVISSAQEVLGCTKLLERMNFPPCAICTSAADTSTKRSMSVIIR
jgi:hypothetical protein